MLNDEMELVKDNIKVVLENIGEGLCGDYNPDDPDDINLLRFTVYKESDGIFEQVDDASYCTCISADEDDVVLNEALQILMNEFHAVLYYAPEQSVKKLGEHLSHISGDSIRARMAIS